MGNEASHAASQARKEKETTKKKEGKHETDSSDDSDDNKATEKAAQELRENEHKRRSWLAQADADSEITDHMIAQAEARNQAKKAKLKLCWPIFSRASTSKLSGRHKFKKFGFVVHSDLTTNLQEWV